MYSLYMWYYHSKSSTYVFLRVAWGETFNDICSLFQSVHNARIVKCDEMGHDRGDRFEMSYA